LSSAYLTAALAKPKVNQLTLETGKSESPKKASGSGTLGSKAGTGVRRFWPAGRPSVSGGRAARQGFFYYAFAGWNIARVEPSISSQTIQDLVQAETALRQLNSDLPSSAALTALADQLLRAEAVASSRIEGLDLSNRGLAQAAFDPTLGARNAPFVLGNIRAIEEALRAGSIAHRVTVDTVLRIHARLFGGTQSERIGGRIRTTQNWIGRGDNPHKAVFIPVPEQAVRSLLADLCRFLARDDLPVLVQAAIAHAQFETIHPFEDGNGRVGRALVQLIMRRRGLAPSHVPPISLVLASNYDAYIAGLTAYRRHDDDEWTGVFVRAAGIAAEGARTLAADIESLKTRWRERAEPRAGSAAAKLIDLLPLHPVFDLNTATEFLGVSDEAARLGIERLERAGVVKEVTKRKWNRAWETVELFGLLDGFERKLTTSPGGVR
jgi:Fic family protein